MVSWHDVEMELYDPRLLDRRGCLAKLEVIGELTEDMLRAEVGPSLHWHLPRTA